MLSCQPGAVEASHVLAARLAVPCPAWLTVVAGQLPATDSPRLPLPPSLLLCWRLLWGLTERVPNTS